MIDWSWPRIGFCLVCGVALGAGIGALIEGALAAGMMCLLVAGVAGFGATLINDRVG